jgi:hypothetical protein
LESNWRLNVAEVGLSGLGATKAAKVLTSTHGTWITDVGPTFDGRFLLASEPYPPNTVGLPEWWTFGHVLPPVAGQTRFPYGYEVTPDGPP